VFIRCLFDNAYNHHRFWKNHLTNHNSCILLAILSSVDLMGHV